MPPDFAALEARVNSAVVRHLANCQASVDGVPVSGIFDQVYVTAADIASTGPALTLLSGLPAGVQQDASQVSITSPYGGGTYTVRGIEADGAGLTVLRLRKS